jgi:hypothetical protein
VKLIICLLFILISNIAAAETVKAYVYGPNSYEIEYSDAKGGLDSSLNPFEAELGVPKRSYTPNTDSVKSIIKNIKSKIEASTISTNKLMKRRDKLKNIYKKSIRNTIEKGDSISSTLNRLPIDSFEPVVEDEILTLNRKPTFDAKLDKQLASGLDEIEKLSNDKTSYLNSVDKIDLEGVKMLLQTQAFYAKKMKGSSLGDSLYSDFQSTMYFGKGMLRGATSAAYSTVNGVVEMVKGAYKVGQDPSKAWDAVNNLIETFDSDLFFDGLVTALDNTYDQFVYGSAEQRGQILGTAAFEIATAVFSFTKLKYVSKLKNLGVVSKTGKYFSKTISALGKIGIKSKEGVRDFIDLSRKIVGNDVGSVRHFSKTMTGNLTRYSPIKEGPLSGIKVGVKTVADTFRSKSYFKYIDDEPTKLYRVYGGNAGEFGPYWSRVKPSGPGQATLDAALLPSFKNSAQKWVEITVPKGTEMFEGIASEMIIRTSNTGIKLGDILGGGSQVYLKDIRIPTGWRTDGGVFK